MTGPPGGDGEIQRVSPAAEEVSGFKPGRGPGHTTIGAFGLRWRDAVETWLNAALGLGVSVALVRVCGWRASGMRQRSLSRPCSSALRLCGPIFCAGCSGSASCAPDVAAPGRDFGSAARSKNPQTLQEHSKSAVLDLC